MSQCGCFISSRFSYCKSQEPSTPLTMKGLGGTSSHLDDVKCVASGHMPSAIPTNGPTLDPMLGQMRIKQVNVIVPTF